jgi:transcription antitermination factor NusG
VGGDERATVNESEKVGQSHCLATTPIPVSVHRVNATIDSVPIIAPPSSASWYVVWSEARAEKKVAQRMAAKGYDVWLPTVTTARQWSDRVKQVTVPLFPGYLFVRTPEHEGYVPMLRTPGVLTLVKEGGKPAQLSHSYVSRLQALVQAPAAEVEPVPDAITYHPGDEVEVQEGALAGLRGVVTELRGRRRLIVWVAAVGRGLLCTIGAAAVRPVP